ncbi:MAG: hypothetical protein ABIA75_11870 [Candidatus Neomarinimicrobiota bacterium]
MWFWLIFIAIGLIFVWSYFQQQAPQKRTGPRAPEEPTPSPKKKKPFIRIERVED